MSEPDNTDQSGNDYITQLIITLGKRVNQQNEILQGMSEYLRDISSQLRQIAIASDPAPNHQRPLSEYPSFDWESIGATVLNKDSDGASAVEWHGPVFMRRSPQNRFDAAVWFSRHIGTDTQGNKKYARLITFKNSEVEPIATKARRSIES